MSDADWGLVSGALTNPNFGATGLWAGNEKAMPQPSFTGGDFATAMVKGDSGAAMTSTSIRPTFFVSLASTNGVFAAACCVVYITLLEPAC